MKRHQKSLNEIERKAKEMRDNWVILHIGLHMPI